jgi:hypothetical protein
MSETWTYYNSNTIQVDGDLTAKYLPNQLLRLTQDGAVKFFVVTAVALVGGNTRLTINGAGVYTLTSSAITARAMASQGAHSGVPFGFVDAATVSGAPPKTTPADTDEVPIRDSETPFGLGKLTWSNIKASLKTYFDALYAVSTNGVTNGDSHNHSGGDGAQIDHGGLAGLADNDHTQYALNSVILRTKFSVAPDGTIYCIGTDQQLRRWNGSSWDVLGGTCLSCSAVSSTVAYAIGTDYCIWMNSSGTWTQVISVAIP